MRHALAVLLAALLCVGCTTTVRREGEVLFLYCTVFCVFRLVDADATIETKLRKALPAAKTAPLDK